MTPMHKVAVGAATVGALLLVAGMIFGNHISFPGGHGTIRDISIALWAFALPWWFEIEEWFAPDDEAGMKRFQRGQKFGRRLWIGVGAMVAIIIGVSAPQYAEGTGNNPASNTQQGLSGQYENTPSSPSVTV